MMVGNRPLLATFFAISLIAPSATPQEKPSPQGPPLSGIWEVDIPLKDGAVIDKRFVKITQKGDMFVVEDLQFGMAAHSHENSGGSVNFFVYAPDKSNMVWLEGKASMNAMSGVITKADSPAVAAGKSWTAGRLGSIWACSNHDKPKHIAKSESEMRDYTKKNGCMGWFMILNAVK
jgi:hypothetical protein